MSDVVGVALLLVLAFYAGRWSRGWRPGWWPYRLCGWRDPYGLLCSRVAGHIGPHLVATPGSHGYRVDDRETSP